MLLFKNSEIAYYRFGAGPARAVCFHGYGENGTYFQFLEKYAGNQYSLIAIDLPFHGKTRWNEGLELNVETVYSIIQLIFEKEFENKDSLFTVIGFSLGARFCLRLFQYKPHLIDKLVLLAPDGLKVNRWYWLATQTWLGNRFFAFTMHHPFWFFGFLKILNQLKLVNSSIFKFVNYYIGEKEVRDLLYQRWTTFRKLTPDLPTIKAEIESQKTPVRLLYGYHDRIILSSVGEKFRKGIEDYCTLSIIHAGHQVLHEKHIEEILPALLH